jgi:hypothetical protein
MIVTPYLFSLFLTIYLLGIQVKEYEISVLIVMLTQRYITMGYKLKNPNKFLAKLYEKILPT